MSNFEDAVNITLQNEGGLEDNKTDPGGITNFGISLRFLQENKIDVNHDGSIDAKDIEGLTIEEAKNIYKTYFWDKNRINLINNQSLANKVFDLSVNMGTEAIKLFQEAINLQSRIKIKPDGLLGPLTINILNNLNPNNVLMEYKKLACLYYQDLVYKNPSLHIFLADWLRRANQ